MCNCEWDGPRDQVTCGHGNVIETDETHYLNCNDGPLGAPESFFGPAIAPCQRCIAYLKSTNGS